MAWLQQDPSGNFHISFRYGGHKFKRSLKTRSQDDADTRLKRLEENIRFVESGRLTIPPDADIPTFLLSDGKLNEQPKVKAPWTMSQLFDAYFDAAVDLEESTVAGMRIHRNHLDRHLGATFTIQNLRLPDLQRYVTRRRRERGLRGRTVSGATIKKEIVTLRTVWNWAVHMGHLTGSFPNTGLKYPKTKEKPPFMTWDEITRRINQGVPKTEQADLWDCLYLGLDQIGALLDHIRESAHQPFIHPMLATAAYTGCRRSELLRSEIPDIDLEQGIITIRERKRVRGKLSSRRVPLSASLRDVLAQWLDNHPGGIHTFVQKLEVERSKKSRTEYGPITRDEANDHFRRAVADSKWKVLKGYHVLRHSFISICASKGVDQRLIDEWVGHTSEETRRRYRHLFPSSQKAALKSVFG